MVSFVTGFSGSGKSALVKQKIKRLAETTDKRIMLIVPEQFSFESERELYSLLGAEKSRRAEVFSFTRLADRVFKLYGGATKKSAGKIEKLIFMNSAVNELKSKFEHFKKAAKYKSFVTRMLSAAQELKTAGVDTARLLKAADALENGELAQKTREICELTDVYDAILARSFSDPTDCLKRALEKLRNKDFFRDTVVFFDEFKSFTGAQYEFISHILQNADECVFSLCTDEKSGVFTVVTDTYNRIKSAARKAGSEVLVPERLSEPRRFSSSALCFAEKNLMAESPKHFEGENDDVHFAVAANIFEETEYVSSKIIQLVCENGYRYRDFAVIIPNAQSYAPVLKSAFENYEITYYYDAPDGIKDTPIIKFASELLRLSYGGYDTEAVISLLKCGLSPFCADDIYEFENYCFIWNIKGADFKTEFTANPNGFDESFGEEEADKLARYNVVREYIIDISSRVRTASGGSAADIGSALFFAIEESGAGEKIKAVISGDSVDGVVSEKYARSWDALLNILDSLAVSAGESYTNAEYFDLFDFACGEYDMGTVPQLADAVTIGDPERIRMDSAKIVFVLGAQKDVFPKTPVNGSVFSEAEQKDFEDMGLSFAAPFEYRLYEQRFNAYKTLAMASDKLFVCASLTGIDGEEQYLSDIFSSAEKIFGKGVVTDISKIGGDFFCRNKKTAFLTLARLYSKNTAGTASIEKVLQSDPLYAGKLAMLENAGDMSRARLCKGQAIDGAFPKNMRISPSGFERFYKCRFAYFCRDGLQVKANQRAELNPLSRGTLIHDVLEKLLKNEGFYAFSSSELENEVEKLLSAYLESVMSGAENKTAQFKYLFSKLIKTISSAAAHMQKELLQSAFKPADFELNIGSGGISGLEFALDGGGKINLIGKIDRVDTANINGENFVRVIDYKSGGRDFNLADLLDGQNMQMLMYLFCITKSGKGKYKDALPAGILYMPSAALKNTAGRNADDVEKVKTGQYKMKGLLLNDAEVLNAMENGVGGVFIPAKLNKSGETAANSSVATKEQFELLYKHVRRCAENMARALRSGDISAVPLDLGNNTTACDYCDYRSVCGVDADDSGEVLPKSEADKQEVFKILEKEADVDELG